MIPAWGWLLLIVIMLLAGAFIWLVFHHREASDRLARRFLRKMRMIIMVFLIASCFAQEPTFDATPGGPGPILLIDAERATQAIESFFCPNCVADEAEVADGHWLFLYGDYINGSWVLNNTTVIV